MKYVWIAVTLSFCNFLYQFAFTESPNYIDAFERSYFQAAALLIVWIMETYPE